MKVEFRRIQGPYGKSRRYNITLPREYAEEVLKQGYRGLALVRLEDILILIPSKGFDIDDLSNRIERNITILYDTISILKGRTSSIQLLRNITEELKAYINTLKSIKIPLKARMIEEVKVKRELEFKEELKSIPSFMRDNPWLEILAKRGTE